MKKILVLLLVIASATTIFAASTSGKKSSTGYWDEEDVITVCNKIIDDCVHSPRVASFEEKNGRPPVVVIGSIKNESSERIDTTIVEKKLQTEILKSGVLEFVAEAGERGAIQEELIFQDQYASLDSAKAIDNAEAADFLMSGYVKTLVDRVSKKPTRTYYVFVSLTNIETQRILWQTEEVITKEFKIK